MISLRYITDDVILATFSFWACYLLSIFKEVVSKHLSVRQTESVVAQRSSQRAPRSTKEIKSQPPFVKRWQDDLSSHLSTKVTIQHNDKGDGQLILSYADEKDLELIASAFLVVQRNPRLPNLLNIVTIW